MEREKLLEEYNVTLESLVEKVKFCYSEEFYKLDDFDKQKYQKDKMATEAHLSTLCEILWGKKFQFDNGLGSLWGMALLSSMFNYGSSFGSSLPSADFLKKPLDKEEVEDGEKEKVFTIPTA